MAARVLSRWNFATRRYFATSASPKIDYMVKREAEAKHAESNMKTWKMLSFFVAVPAVLICSYNALTKEQEHHSHPRAEFKPYSHLRIRNKVVVADNDGGCKPINHMYLQFFPYKTGKNLFPWGDGNHSLFHNSHTNALPEGYEDGEDGEHEH